MASNLLCPACGSTQVTTTTESRSLTVPFAKKTTFTTIVHTCKNCRESGDFTGDNETKIAEAEQIASREAIENILTALKHKNRTLAYIERALRLPQRTINRWKNGECSSAVAALLRVIGTYPWVIEVADNDFAEPFATQKLLAVAVSVLHERITPPPGSTAPSIFINANINITAANFNTDFITVQMDPDTQTPHYEMLPNQKEE